MVNILFRKWLPGILVHVLLAAAILYYYLSNGATRWEAIPIHSYLLISCFYFLLIFWAFIFWIWKKPNRWIYTLFCGSHIVLSIWIILLHLASITGFIILSDQVSIQAFLIYVPTLPDISRQIGINPSILAGITFIFISLVSLLWYMWYKQLYHIPETLQNYDYSKFQVLLGVALLILTLIPFWGFKTLIEKEWMKSLQSEPFANHFRPSSSFSFTHTSALIDFDKHIKERNDYQAKTRDRVNTNDLPNIVLIMLDGARADHMSVYGYHRDTTPFLNSLNEAGYYSKASFATSTCTDSICGITTMFASQFFTKVHFLNYKLHDVLHDIGYGIHFFLSGDHTRAYANLERFYGEDITTFKDGFSESGQQPTDDEMVLFHLKNSQYLQNDNPAFIYIHLMSLHYYGVKYEQHTRFTPEYPESVHSLTRMIYRGTEQLDSLTTSKLTNTYDNRMVQTDDYIRRIFHVLEDQGILDDSIVIITSDHGESLGDGNLVGHGNEIHHAEINIPLIFFSKNKPAINQDIPYATLIDIAPSILGLIDMPVPSTWEGKDIFTTQRNYSYHMSQRRDGSNNAVILISDHQNYLYSRNRITGNERYFNLTKDPYKELDEYYVNRKKVLTRARELYNVRFEN